MVKLLLERICWQEQKERETVREKNRMYRKTPPSGELPEIRLYFEGRLNPENRWVKMAERLPRADLESDSAKHFSGLSEVSEHLLQCGRKRLFRAARGEDFFQAVPSAKHDADLINWYLQNFGQIINSDCAKLAVRETAAEKTFRGKRKRERFPLWGVPGLRNA